MTGRIGRDNGQPVCTSRAISPVTWPLWLVLLAGLIVRLAFVNIDGSGYDIEAFQEWTRQMLAHPLDQFYAADLEVPQDHLPGDLWVLYALGTLWQWAGGAEFSGNGAAMVALKSVAIVLDLALALVVAAIVRPSAGPRVARIVLLAIVFNPGLVFISAIWGQWNVLATTLVALAALFIVRWGGAGLVPALPVLAAATLVKPQLLVLILPIAVLVARFSRGGVPAGLLIRNVAIGGVASVVLVLAAIVPFDVGFAGMGMRWTIVERVQFAADRYTTTTMGAYNLWSLAFPGDDTDDRANFLAGVTWQQLGFVLFGMAVLYGMAVAWRWPEPCTGMIVAFAVIATALFMVVTRSHERYLVDGMVLSIVAAGIVPRLRPAAIVLALGLFLNMWFVWGFWHPAWVAHIGYSDWLYRALASVNIVGFALLLWRAWPLETDSEPTRNPTDAHHRRRHHHDGD